MSKLNTVFKQCVKRTLISLFAPKIKKFLKKNDQIKLIGVAGSVAKTSTKFALVKALEGAGKKVLTHDGAYNDPFSTMFVLLGVKYPNINNPVDIFKSYLSLRRSSKLSQNYDYAVLELGTDTPGEMKQFGKYLSLEFCLLTAISPEHMVNFGKLDVVAEEELEILNYSKKLLACRDLISKKYQKEIEKRAESVSWYGSASGNNVVVKVGGLVDIGLRTRREVSVKLSGQKYSIKSGLLHLHSGFVLAGAVLACSELGIMDSGVASALEGLRPAAGRGRLIAGKKGSIIIDDSYNNVGANVSIASLDLLYEFNTRRRIAVLGGINELSEELEPEAHTQVALHLNKKKLEEVVLIGVLAKKYYKPILSTAEIKFKYFSNPYKAGDYLQNKLVAGMVVLVKGSQNGIYSEEAIKPLLQDQKDENLLVRQSSEWLVKKRQNFGLS